MTLFFTVVALLVLFGLIIFQVALAAGAPLGRFAWGGKSTYLPHRLRIASLTSIILYMLFIAFICSKAGIVAVIQSTQVLGVGMWIFTAYSFIGIGMNAISRSKPERDLMTPIATVLALSFLIVTIS